MFKTKMIMPAAAFLAIATLATGAEARTIRQPAPSQQNAYDEDFDEDEPYCREYTQTFSIGGERETGYGTACLQPDGSWKIVSQDDEEKGQPDDRSQADYVVREDAVYVEPREVIFAPGHRWHRRPVAVVARPYGHPYPPYGNPYHSGHWRQ